MQKIKKLVRVIERKLPRRIVLALASIAVALLILKLVTATLSGVAQAQDGAEQPDQLILFFSPETASQAAKLASQLKPEGKRIRFFPAKPGTRPHPIIRPVLLIADYSKLTDLLASPALQDLIKLLSAGGSEVDIRLWDTEGLKIARDLKITRLPTLAYSRGGRWHVATGAAASIPALVNCGEKK